MSAQQVDLEAVEARIMELCERAKAKGWQFSALTTCVSGARGCALQACGAELDRAWWLVASDLGLLAHEFGAGFDGVALGRASNFPYSRPEARSHCDLGARIARRLMREVTP